MKLFCLAALAATAVYSQGSKPTFEVASVKPAPPPTGGGIYTSFSGGPGSNDPGKITYTNASLRDLIRAAYGVQPYQIAAPAWISTARFDIVAKLPPDATREQVALMWQSLLAERFMLTSHTETKEMQVYALVIAKNGPKLTESADDSSVKGGAPKGQAPASSWTGSGSGGGASGAPQVGFSIPRGDGLQPAPPGAHKMSGSRLTMSRLAEMLTAVVEHPVLDMTGLTGRYDVKLAYSPENAVDVAAPTLFMALEQELGLKLEARKSPVEVLAIDRVEKVPTEN